MAKSSYSHVARLRHRVQLYESLAALENTNKYDGRAAAARQKLEQAQAALPATGLTLPEARCWTFRACVCTSAASRRWTACPSR